MDMKESEVNRDPSLPTPRFTVVTLGVSDMRSSIAFYEALGFARKLRATGEAVAFFGTSGTRLALFSSSGLAHDATLPEMTGPAVLPGMMLDWNSNLTE